MPSYTPRQYSGLILFWHPHTQLGVGWHWCARSGQRQLVHGSPQEIPAWGKDRRPLSCFSHLRFFFYWSIVDLQHCVNFCCARYVASVMSNPCDPMDCSPPGSSVHGILQARTLEWVVIPFSRGSSWPRDQNCASNDSCKDNWVLNHERHLGGPSCGCTEKWFWVLWWLRWWRICLQWGDLGSIPGSGGTPGEGNGNPLQYSCLEFHGQRSLVGYSPQGRKQSDTTEQL